MQDTPETPGSGGTDPLAKTPPPSPTPSPYGAPGGPGVGRSKGLFERARDILTRPAAEWSVADGESATVGSIMVPSVVALAAIPPLALLLGLTLLGGTFASFLFGYFLQMAIAFYILSVAVAFALGFVIDALAPTFGGTKNLVQALKLSAYSHTPLWVGGLVLLLIVMAPALFWLWFLAGFAYGAYILYLGLPRLMRVPADKAQAYAGAAIGVWFVLLLIARWLSTAMVGGPFGF